jgi:hypothetical protein
MDKTRTNFGYATVSEQAIAEGTAILARVIGAGQGLDAKLGGVSP